MRTVLAHFLRGIVIGLANVIPGVSGGTMALVLGIYDRLIGALDKVIGGTVALACALGRRESVAPQAASAGASRRSRIVGLWRELDATFLASLTAGALAAVGGASWLLLRLLHDHPTPTYGFFFGLVAASVVVPYALLSRKSWPELGSAVVAVALMVLLSTSMGGAERLEAERRKEALRQDARAEAVADAPDHSAASLLRLGGIGAIAISAMILPGISGSFLLLVLGAYEDVLRAVTRIDLIVLGVFGAGCLVGMALFVKLLHYLLRRWHSPTMAFLAGLMVGSLYELWPFKERVAVGRKLVDVERVWPRVVDLEVAATLGAALLGAALVIVFHVYELRSRRGDAPARKRTPDLPVA